MHSIEEPKARKIAVIERLAAEADSPVQRWLAIAQQGKDSITIGLLLATGMLFFGILFGVAIPGLVLYCLRWKLVPEGAIQTRKTSLWLLTVIHEVVWATIFCSDHSPADEFMQDFMQGYLGIGYTLGALASIVALLNSFRLNADNQ